MPAQSRQVGQLAHSTAPHSVRRREQAHNPGAGLPMDRLQTELIQNLLLRHRARNSSEGISSCRERPSENLVRWPQPSLEFPVFPFLQDQGHPVLLPNSLPNANKCLL